MSDKNQEAVSADASTVTTTAAALRLTRPSAGWEWGDDLCPPWWPRRRWPWAILGGESPIELLAADRSYQALTLCAQSFGWSDGRMAREVRAVALGHLRDAAPVLARGARFRWDVDPCPEWPWRRPWPPRADGLDQLTPAVADPAWGRDLLSDPMPGRAAGLLDVLRTLQAYNVAARIVDPEVRGALTVAIGTRLVAQIAALTDALG